MVRALELARRGWGRVAPNPLVGAVLLRDGEVVGEGYHAEFGGPHAEVQALASCPDPAGATCVVTLEPCAHTGKTPPCTDAIIAGGVSRVVFALRDPDPNAAGGATALRQAGIEVVEGVGSEAAAAVNAPYLCSHARPDRPFVAVKLATSLDGFITDHDGRSQWISGPAARDWVHWLRAGFDAIGVGRRTAEIDDPSLTVRGPVIPRITPRRIVFMRGSAIRRDLEVVRTAEEVPTVLVTAHGAGQELAAGLGGSEVTVHEAADLSGALEMLAREGVRALLVEGGGRLASAMLEADLVDRLYWIQAPIWLGQGTPAFRIRHPTALRNVHRWMIVEQQRLGQDTLLVVDRGICSRE